MGKADLLAEVALRLASVELKIDRLAEDRASQSFVVTKELVSALIGTTLLVIDQMVAAKQLQVVPVDGVEHVPMTELLRLTAIPREKPASALTGPLPRPKSARGASR